MGIPANPTHVYLARCVSTPGVRICGYHVQIPRVRPVSTGKPAVCSRQPGSHTFQSTVPAHRVDVRCAMHIAVRAVTSPAGSTLLGADRRRFGP